MYPTSGNAGVDLRHTPRDARHRASLGLLSTTTDTMTTGAASERPPGRARVLRPWCLVAALLGAVLALVPPLDTVARGSDYAAAVQFSLLAIVVPALTTLGSPWRIFTLSAGASAVRRLGPVDRLAEGRRRHHELTRSVAYIGCDLAVVIAWHAPPAVAFVASAWWPAFVEAGILLLFGMGSGSSSSTRRLSPRARRTSGGQCWQPSPCGSSGSSPTWSACRTIASTQLLPRRRRLECSRRPGDRLCALMVRRGDRLCPGDLLDAAMRIKTEEDPDTELIALLREERRRATPPLNDGSEGTSSP